MKKLFILLIFVTAMVYALIGKSAPAYNADETFPMVIVFNMSEENKSIMIGDSDGEIFSTPRMNALETTILTPLDATGTFSLYEWDEDLSDWTVMYRAFTEEEYEVTLKQGKVLGLIILPDNYVEDFELSYDYTGYGKIMFANLSSQSLAFLEVSKEFGSRKTVWLDGLSYYNLSSFADAPSDSFALFWQTYEQSSTGEYFFNMAENGEPALSEVTWGKWYVMMIYDKDDGTVAEMLEITPDQSLFK